ncbi:hypothetical protein Hypma_010807 [Hypsizygus marmoreus]|uniref:F-box domain-containing protein n=1 Tax=Hypsizygus marmoreus TaxID=39966 RepID=A0A369JJ91_HYPMA|nr:hypothetical protein Hypma_010807 [Hypsizygus marmoreus]
MHHSLLINEITSLIFEELDSSTLASIAGTCRAFTDPALDVLWRSQIDIGPLIRVMPGDLWTIVLLADAPVLYKRTKIIKFTRSLDESDWSRFEYYGRRIHKLAHPLESSPIGTFVVHEDVFVALSAYRPIRTFLPNLRELSLDLGYPYVTKHVPFFQCMLGPGLRRLSIFSNPRTGTSLSQLLLSISRTSHAIQSLDLVLQAYGSSEDIAALRRFLCSQRDLHHVDVKCVIPIPMSIPTEAISHLARLPCLNSWRSAAVSLGTEHQFSTMRGGRFASLQHFSFIAASWDSAAKVMSGMRLSLISLSITVGCQTRPALDIHDSFQDFLESFVGHSALASLSDFRLTGEFHIPDDFETKRSTFEALQTILFSLTSSLRHLSLCVDGLVSQFNDIWLSQAAIRWPALQVLQLKGFGSPNITLEGLIPLLRYCPQLEDLDVSPLLRPFPSRLLRGIGCNTRITDLIVQVGIENPVSVFRCLVLMFPNIQRIRLSYYYSSQREDFGAYLTLDRLLAESIECAA